MTANYVAREGNYQGITSFGEGTKAIRENFEPLDAYPERIDTLLGEIAALGYREIDLWVAHCHPEWATPAHVEAIQAALKKHQLRVVTLAGGFKRAGEDLEKVCRLANALDCPLLAMSSSTLPDQASEIAAILRDHGVRLGFENHPNEKTPEDVLEKIGGGKYPEIGVTFDTGWWITHDIDQVQALEALKEHLLAVHFKDIQAPGAHEAARWGEGRLDLQGTLDKLAALRFDGWISLEYEPFDHDPSPACQEFLPRAREMWNQAVARSNATA